jgi:hypothetical protein
LNGVEETRRFGYYKANEANEKDSVVIGGERKKGRDWNKEDEKRCGCC